MGRAEAAHPLKLGTQNGDVQVFALLHHRHIIRPVIHTASVATTVMPITPQPVMR